MTTIAITGVGGLVGRRLVAALDVHPEVTRVVGVDRQAPHGLSSAKLVFRDADVRDARLAEAFDGVDVVIHLASISDPSHDRDALRAVNVDGAVAAFQAAADAQVRQFVYLSTTFVYGAHPDNAVPLTEDHPRRATPGLPYAEHAVEVERHLDVAAAAGDRPAVTVLRTAPVLGPGVEDVLTRMLELPRLPVVHGHEPPLQFVHVHDLVTALVHVVDEDLTGIYNVTADGWLSLAEVVGVARLGTFRVGEEVALSLSERLWDLGLGEHPPGIVLHLMHPCVASNDKLRETGWQPAHSNRDTLAVTVDEHAPYVAFAGARTTWRTVGLVGALMSVLAGIGAWRGVRRWRRRQLRSS